MWILFLSCLAVSDLPDLDADGFTSADDCDDENAEVHPGATEVCNGLDDDCDGDVDGGAIAAPTWYADADADGFGDPTVSVVACDAPIDYVADDSDCDDTTPLVTDCA